MEEKDDDIIAMGILKAYIASLVVTFFALICWIGIFGMWLF